MNGQRIVRGLRRAGFEAQLAEGGSHLQVVFQVEDRPVALLHEFPDELLRVPKFDLVDGHGFGKLAHVLPSAQTEGGEVCIGDVASTSVNRDRPMLVYRQTLAEHIRLLTRLIKDPKYNRIEQLREFGAHWKAVCRAESVEFDEIFVAWDGLTTDRLQVRTRPRSQAENGLQTQPVAMAGALANERGAESIRAVSNWSSRSPVGTGVGVPLACLLPAPPTRADVPSWYFDLLAQVEPESLSALAQR